jgi:regulator of replication initiation timing
MGTGAEQLLSVSPELLLEVCNRMTETVRQVMTHEADMISLTGECTSLGEYNKTMRGQLEKLKVENEDLEEHIEHLRNVLGKKSREHASKQSAAAKRYTDRNELLLAYEQRTIELRGMLVELGTAGFHCDCPSCAAHWDILRKGAAWRPTIRIWKPKKIRKRTWLRFIDRMSRFLDMMRIGKVPETLLSNFLKASWHVGFASECPMCRKRYDLYNGLSKVRFKMRYGDVVVLQARRRRSRPEKVHI